MISDEMRELLSAYVDGELRDTDAARVEELSKRDAELRREIASYRKLRKKLSQATEGENYIETVWGRGYVLRDPEADAIDRRVALGA